jgi:hypothetical protein
VAILTFAILFHLSVVLDEGKHLGENHRNLVIPAAYVKCPCVLPSSPLLTLLSLAMIATPGDWRLHRLNCVD